MPQSPLDFHRILSSFTFVTTNCYRSVRPLMHLSNLPSSHQRLLRPRNVIQQIVLGIKNLANDQHIISYLRWITCFQELDLWKTVTIWKNKRLNKTIILNELKNELKLWNLCESSTVPHCYASRWRPKPQIIWPLIKNIKNLQLYVLIGAVKHCHYFSTTSRPKLMLMWQIITSTHKFKWCFTIHLEISYLS